MLYAISMFFQKDCFVNILITFRQLKTMCVYYIISYKQNFIKDKHAIKHDTANND